MTLHYEPTPEQLSLTDRIRNAYEDLTFLTAPSYEEIYFKNVDLGDKLGSTSLHAKLIMEAGQLDGHVSVTSEDRVDTFTKMGSHDQWLHSGMGGHMLSNFGMLGYIQNLVGTSIQDPAFHYLDNNNGDHGDHLDDGTMLRGTSDSIAAKSQAHEHLRGYVHSITRITSGGELLEYEGVTVGKVDAEADDGSVDTFWFACLDIPLNADPEYIQYKKNQHAAIMPGKEMDITCRVEVHENSPARYSAFVHDPDTGLLTEVGVPNAEEAIRPLLEQAIDDYLATV